MSDSLHPELSHEEGKWTRLYAWQDATKYERALSILLGDLHDQFGAEAEIDVEDRGAHHYVITVVAEVEGLMVETVLELTPQV